MPNICVVTIYVSNMEHAKDFYCEKLGFFIEKEYSDDIIQLKHEGMPFILQQVKENSAIKFGVEASTVIALSTNSITQTIEDFKEKNITLLFDTPQKCPPGYFTVIQDPFGNHIEILEFE